MLPVWLVLLQPAAAHSSLRKPVTNHQCRRPKVLFRAKVFTFLLREELISSWKNSGFSVHNAVHVAPGDAQSVEALIRYMMKWRALHFIICGE